MKRSLLAYNGFGTVAAIALWYGLVLIGVEPTILFVGAVAGILLCAGMARKAAPWWAIVVSLLALFVVSLIAATISESTDVPHTFIVLGTLALGLPITASVHGHYRFDLEDILPGVPAFMAFVWVEELGGLWGIGAAFFMFAAQVGLAYWLRLQKLKQVSAT